MAAAVIVGPPVGIDTADPVGQSHVDVVNVKDMFSAGMPV